MDPFKRHKILTRKLVKSLKAVKYRGERERKASEKTKIYLQKTVKMASFALHVKS